MATVHLGRLDGSAGFSRTVAIKRLHPHLCEDPAFTGAFADEARLAARIRHPNVVPTLDVVSTEGELLIVMEYVDGDSLSSLVRRMGEETIPLPIVVAIVSEMLHGLHSAHEAKSETGKPLDIVHRDVSPQNLLVGADGVARLVDFGIARASSKTRQATTGENDLKGKLAYMAPEQIRRENVSRRTDIYAAGIVLWELLTGQRLFSSENEAQTMEKILVGWVQPPRTIRLDLPEALNEITLRALDPDPDNRFETAREMAVALEDSLGRALGRDVGAWVEETAAETLATRRAMIARVEKESSPEATQTNLSLPASGPRSGEPAEAPTTPRRQSFPKERESAKQMQPTVPDRVERLRDEPTTGPSFVPPLEPEPELQPERPPGVPLGMEYERTVTSFGEELSHRQAAPKRSRTDRAAYAVFGAAVLVTLIVGLSWSKISPPAPPPPAPAVRATEEPTPPVAEPIQTQPPPAPPAPDPSQHAIEKPPPTTVQWPAMKPTIRPRPKPAPAKQPCVAKVDPATGRTSYVGDCN